MGIKSMNYLDLSPSARAKAAKEMREQIQQSLRGALPDQAAALKQKLDNLAQWEKGTLTRVPVDHSVEVHESVSVKEETK